MTALKWRAISIALSTAWLEFSSKTIGQRIFWKGNAMTVSLDITKAASSARRGHLIPGGRQAKFEHQPREPEEPQDYQYPISRLTH
jgi:hypothetical protein